MSYRNDSGHADFVPATSTPGLSAKLKEQLTQTRVAPEQSEAPEAATDGRATSATTTTIRNVDQRTQAAR
jgi:hypothetical protein